MSYKEIHKLLFGTLRRQLIVGVAVVHAVMMAVFVWDMTTRNQAMLLERQSEQAFALAQTLATSAAGWLAANDLAGLQELAVSQQRYPELQFAMLLDRHGRVLAHTDRNRIGLYLQDMPEKLQESTMHRSAALVDVMAPAMIGDINVGWVRVGIGQRVAGERLAEITRDGICYSIIAILIGSICAWFMSNRITGRLGAIQTVMGQVRDGRKNARVYLDGSDEAADLASGFNSMITTIEELHERLEERIAEEVAANRAKDHLMAHQARFAAMGEMLSNIAHQWRQPLNNIAIITQNISSEFEENLLTKDACNRYVSESLEILKEMSQTITAFSHFYHPESSVLFFDLKQAIEEVLELLQGEFNTLGIKVEQQLDADIGIFAHRKEFLQVLMHLLRNSKEALQRQGSPHSWVFIRSSYDARFARILIRDNGGGIATDALEKIFDPYYTSKFKSKGTGMGLYLSKLVVEQHLQGRISVSNTDEGVEVLMELPITPRVTV